jgi:hypothetical protein
MRSHAAAIVLAICAALSCALPLRAQATTQPATVEELQQEIAALRKEVADLKVQIAATAPKAAAKAGVPDPAEKVYPTFRAMLDEMPQELWPNPHDGWDKFNSDKPEEWISLNLQGKWVKARGTAHTAGRAKQDDAGWFIPLQINPNEQFNFHGVNVSIVVHIPYGEPVDLRLPEELIKRYDKSKTDVQYEIRAQVAKVSLNSTGHEATVTVTLQNITVLKPAGN